MEIFLWAGLLIFDFFWGLTCNLEMSSEKNRSSTSLASIELDSKCPLDPTIPNHTIIEYDWLPLSMEVVIGRCMQQSSLNVGKPGEKLHEGFGSSGFLLPTNQPTRQPTFAK